MTSQGTARVEGEGGDTTSASQGQPVPEQTKPQQVLIFADRKVDATDEGRSCYALCRTWVRNGEKSKFEEDEASGSGSGSRDCDGEDVGASGERSPQPEAKKPRVEKKEEAAAAGAGPGGDGNGSGDGKAASAEEEPMPTTKEGLIARWKGIRKEKVKGSPLFQEASFERLAVRLGWTQGDAA